MIDQEYTSLLFKQNYNPKSIIDGVEFHNLRVFSDEGGTFLENARINENNELTFYDAKGILQTLKNFCLRQINHSTLLPGPIKAWHVHKIQTDVWTVPPGGGHILAGLFDLRENSPTKGKKMRVYLGENSLALLQIPPGVAHGYRNIGQKNSSLIYFIDQHFNPEDEYRLPWNSLEFNWGKENG